MEDIRTRHALSVSDESSVYFMDRQRELEHRVMERTKQLASQVVGTQAAMTQLHSEKERANRYLDVSEAIVVELNRRGEIEIINRRGAHLLDYQQSDLIGKNGFDIAIPDDICDAVRKIFEQTVSNKMEPADYFKNKILTRDGNRRSIKQT